MNNTMGDLNNYLFAQLERLDDESLSQDQLDNEIKRANGISQIAGQILQVERLAFNVMKHCDEGMNADAKIPKMLEVAQ